MTTTEKDFILEYLKWPFSWSEFFRRYFILIFPIAIILISSSMFYGGLKYGHIYKNNFMNPFFFTALIGLKLGLFLFFYILQRIVSEYIFVQLEMPKNISFIEIPEKLGTTNWVVASSKTDLIVLNTNISFFSWGEQITIVKVDDHSILVNSRPKGQQPFTFGKERYNFNKIKSLLN